MSSDVVPDPASGVLAAQPALLQKLLLDAADRHPSANAALSQRVAELLAGADPGAFMHDPAVLDGLRGLAIQHLEEGQLDAALAWGKAAYVAERRFAHCWLGLIDIVAASGALTGYMRPAIGAAPSALIPANLVQFWDRPQPPRDVAALIEGWKLPGYSHLLFNDQTARGFIGDCYDAEALRIYESIEHVAGKSDLFRLAWLAEHGGIYVDADDRCVGDVGALLPSGSGMVLNWSAGPPPCVNNWFVAARPRHPMVRLLLAQALDTLKRAAALGLRLSPWLTTGPGLYSMVLMDEVAQTAASGAPGSALRPAARPGRLPSGVPPRLADLSFQRESDYRPVVQPVHDLDYRSDQKANWKLAYS